MQTIIEKLLEVLQGGAENTVDILYAMSADKSTSHRRLRASMKYGPKQFKTDWAFAYRERRTYHVLLNRLKRDGLVKKEAKRNGLWNITKQGKEKLFLLRGKRKNPFSLQTIHFDKGARGLTILTFDIPESERKKRRWIRQSLKFMDFRLLQKSVWAGNTQLPKEFIDALRERELIRYVHIFGVGERGTIQEIK